jgi:ABC-2 type transport system permease protein
VNLAFLLGSIRRTLSEPRFLVFTIALPVVLALTIGGSVRNTPMAGTTGATFFMVSMAMFGAMAGTVNSGARIAIDRTSGWMRQLRLTPLTPRNYVLSKALVSMLIALPAILAVCAVGVLFQGVHQPVADLGRFVLFAWLALVPFAALGVAIGYLATGETMQAMTAIIFNVLAIAGGTWWDVDAAGGGMATFAHLLPSYWATRVARSPFTGQGLTWGGLAVMVAWTVGLLAVSAHRYHADLARSA